MKDMSGPYSLDLTATFAGWEAPAWINGAVSDVHAVHHNSTPNVLVS